MFFLFFPLLLFSLEININYLPSKEILTLKNNFNFSCYKKKDNIICKFDKLPSIPIFPTSTKFFKIVPLVKGKKFFLIIKTDKNVKIISNRDDLYKKPVLEAENLKFAKKWIIIVNDNLLSNNSLKGLKFYFKPNLEIYSPAVDENNNPISVPKEEDVKDYFLILNDFNKGKDVSLDIDSFLKKYPNSIFLSDVLYIKMRLLERRGEFKDLIKIGKEWIKKYSYDDKLPKVLLLIGKAYSKEGFFSDANYIFNRIIIEYPNTKEAVLAKIYLADQLLSLGDVRKSLKMYKEILYSTKDIDIASLVAIKIANIYMNKKEVKKALEYYKKVYMANKKFFLKNRNLAFNIAKRLADNKLYKLAIEILSYLLPTTKVTSELYERIVYYLALWNYNMGNYKNSLRYINLYLSRFPYGVYSDKLRELKDKVLLDFSDTNISRQLLYIENILKEYNQSDITYKALVKKAKILYKLKKYDEILKMEDKLNLIPEEIFNNKHDFLKKVKENYVIYLLNKGNCIKAINLLEKYKITLDKKYDDKIYKCAMKAMDYKLASRICNKYLNSTDDKIFIKWIKRKIEALKELRNYKDLIIAIDDLCGVYKKCYKYKLYKFFALWNLGKYKEALEVANSIRVKNIKNSDVYIKIVKWALKNRNYLLATVFAKKIINLQEYFKVYPYSPFIEFIYAKYAKNKKEAIKILKKLLKRVEGEDKAKALFILSNLTSDEKYLEECLKVKDSKLWKKLCEDALNVF